MIETGASPLHQHRIPAHPAHRRLIIGVSDSRLSWNRLWASPRPARPPCYLWSGPVPTPRALKPPVVVHTVSTSCLVQVGRSPARPAQLLVGAGSSGRLSAGRGGHREWRAPVFTGTVIFGLFWEKLSLKTGQQLVIFRLYWACEGGG